MSWVKPAPGRISSPFGRRSSPGGIGSTTHLGADIGCSPGTVVVASAAGKVVTAALSGGFGALVVIDHGGGHRTYYAHLSKFLVTAGRTVTPGQRIGLSGGARGSWGAGTSTGPHLHTEHRVQGVPVDPAPYWTTPAAGPASTIVVPAQLRPLTKAGKRMMYLGKLTATGGTGDVAAIPEGGAPYVFTSPAEYNDWRGIVQLYNSMPGTPEQNKLAVPPALAPDTLLFVSPARFAKAIEVQGA